MRKLLGISGKKGAGKTSACNFLHAVIMSNITDNDGGPFFEYVRLDTEGNLIVPVDRDGVVEPYSLDLDTNNMDLQNYVEENISPFVNKIVLSRPLKVMLHTFFDIEWEDLHGVGNTKNKPTKYKKNQLLSRVLKKEADEDLLIRDLIEYVGLVFTTLNPDCFVDYGLSEYSMYNQMSENGLSIIEDIRRENEFYKIKDSGGKVIRLLNNPFNKTEGIEAELDDLSHDQYDLVIDNSILSMEETHTRIFEWMKNIGWF